MIERIEVRAVGPEVARFTWAWNLPEQSITLTLVRVFDTEGNEGVGATPSYSTGGYDLSILESLRLLVPRVVGTDPLMREGLWHDLQDLTLPVLPGAKSALDIAIWDLVARQVGLPLHRYMGGGRDRLPAYASTPLLPDAAAYVALCHDLRQQGFRAIKFHAWCDPERDLAMLRAVHAEHGGAGLAFMHDAEQRYDRRSALRVALELEEMGFAWLEAPLPDEDLDGYAELRRRSRVPIIPGGNTILDLRQVEQALRREPWDALRFDATIAGGFTPSRKLVALGEAWSLRSELQSWGFTLIQAANFHLGLSTTTSGYLELPVPYEPYEYGVENPYRVQPDGYVAAPTEPGLGIRVNWELMEKATLASFTSTSKSPEPA